MEKKERILVNCIIVFKCLFILALLVSAVPYLHEIISPYMRLFLAAGLFLAGADFLMKNNRWRAPRLWVLLVFAGAYAITIVVNRDSYFVENAKAWLYMLMIFLLFYGFDLKRSREDMRREMGILFHTFLGGVFVCSLACLFTYLFSYNIPYMIGESHMYWGMYDNRLWGLYNPNTGATLEVLAIFMSLAFLTETGKKAIGYRVFHVLNLIVQVICLVLSNSRAPMVVAAAGAAVFLGVYASGKFACKTVDGKPGYRFRSAGIGIASGILVLALSAGGGMVLRDGLSYVPPMLKEMPISGPEVFPEYFESEKKEGKGKEEDKEKSNDKDKKEEKEKPKKVDLTRKEKEEERAGGVLTGRGDLWQAGFKGFLDSPVFGTGREGVYDSCQGYLQDKIWQPSLKDGGLHNILLTVLVASGAVGFGILVIFVILTLKDMFLYGFARKGFLKNRLFLCNFVMLCGFAVTEMLEARILYRVSIFYVMFWLIYGYAVYDAKKDEETVE